MQEFKAERFRLREIAMKAEAETMALPKPKPRAKKRARVEEAPEPAPTPRMVPGGELTQSALRELLPPRAHIWRSNTGFAWCGHLAPFNRDSASWHLYGHREAGLLVLRSLWRKFLVVEGREQDDCPIKGLFDPEIAVAVATLPPS